MARGHETDQNIGKKVSVTIHEQFLYRLKKPGRADKKTEGVLHYWRRK